MVKDVKKSPAKATKKAAVKKDKKDKPKKGFNADGSVKVKKPPSGFILFGMEARPTLKAQNPGLTFGETGKELGRLWGLKSDSEKAKYKVA